MQHDNKAAFLRDLDWASVNCQLSAHLCPDSQSLLKAIQSGARDIEHIRQRLDSGNGLTIYICPPVKKYTIHRKKLLKRPTSIATAKALARRTNRPQIVMVYEQCLL